MRDSAIEAGFALLCATQLHRLLAPLARGRGAILMFHHVCRPDARGFAPNRLLEISPGFLDTVLARVEAAGFDIVALDEAVARLARPAAKGGRPFAVLTFDDGYRDNVEHALPVLERRSAPFTLYVATGFADRSARLWWRELEAAVRGLDEVRVATPGGRLALPARIDAEKSAAFGKIYWLLRGQGEDVLLGAIARLCDAARIDGRAIVQEACLGWEGIAALARHPLCTIGAHTLTHPRLAKLPDVSMRREIEASRAQIEARLGRPVRHLSYPVGDPASAGPREFAAARDLGFASAVTTRPGMVLDAHAQRLHALPRLSINGKWQRAALVDVLLSGVPFALLNRGRAA